MKRGKTNRRHGERGAALLIAVVMMGVFAIMGTAYWRHLHVTLAHARGNAKLQVSRELAEAGIARAVAEMRAGNTAFTAADRVPLGEGVYSVAISPGPGDTREIIAMGALADGETLSRTVRIRALLHLDAAGKPQGVEYFREAP